MTITITFGSEIMTALTTGLILVGASWLPRSIVALATRALGRGK